MISDILGKFVTVKMLFSILYLLITTDVILPTKTEWKTYTCCFTFFKICSMTEVFCWFSLANKTELSQKGLHLQFQPSHTLDVCGRYCTFIIHVPPYRVRVRARISVRPCFIMISHVSSWWGINNKKRGVRKCYSAHLCTPLIKICY